MTKLGERLLERLAATGVSQAELARRVGITQPAINHLIKRGTGGSAHLHRIAKELGTTPEYLLGEADEFGGSVAADIRAASRNLPSGRDPDLVELDEIDLRYGLGGTYVDGPITAEKRQFSRAWLRQFTGAPPEQLFWASGDGDSMEPTIRSGEVVLIDRSQLTPRMGDGIWAIAWGDVGMIKRLRPLPDGTVEIHSDNQAVRPGLASDGDLHVIGRVVAVVRRL